MGAGAATRSRGRCSALNTSYRDRSPRRSRHLDSRVSSHSGRSTALAFPALSLLALVLPTRLRTTAEAARVPRAKSNCQHGQNQLAHATESLAGGPRTRGLRTPARRAPPSVASRDARELRELAAADQETDGESGYRGNADCFPRLITHVTITRLERFLGLALHLIGTV